MKVRVLTYLLVLTLIAPLASPIQTPAKAFDQALKVKEGNKCEILNLPPGNRKVVKVYVWDNSLQAFVFFKCSRNDTQSSRNTIWSCGDKVNKKFLVRNFDGEPCIWKVPPHPKTKKPMTYRVGGRVNEKCVDNQGFKYDDIQYFVTDNILKALKCNTSTGLWEEFDSISNTTSSQDKSLPSNSNSSNLPNGFGRACQEYAGAVLKYQFYASNTSSIVYLQEAKRDLMWKSDTLMKITYTNSNLRDLGAAIPIINKFAGGKWDNASSIDPVSLTLAITAFNLSCGISLRITR